MHQIQYVLHTTVGTSSQNGTSGQLTKWVHMLTSGRASISSFTASARSSSYSTSSASQCSLPIRSSRSRATPRPPPFATYLVHSLLLCRVVSRLTARCRLSCHQLLTMITQSVLGVVQPMPAEPMDHCRVLQTMFHSQVPTSPHPHRLSRSSATRRSVLFSISPSSFNPIL
jgi:hypothetical protein